MKKIEIILICSVILFGCNNSASKKQEQLKVLEIDSSSIEIIEDKYPKIINIARDFKNEKEFKLSDIASNIEYVKLETTADSYIGGGNSTIHLDNKYIYIYSQKRLLQFSRNGKFVKEIGRNGRGPGEFPGSKGITVDKKKKSIYIIANYLAKVLEYNYESGEFLGSFPIDKRAGSSMIPGVFQAVVTDTFAVLSHPMTQFRKDYFFAQIVDIKGNIVHNQKSHIYSTDDKEKIKERSLPAGNQTWKIGNEIRFFEYLNDTIYSFINDQFKPSYIFNLGKYKGDFDVMVKIKDERKSKSIAVRSFAETSGYLLFKCLFDNKWILSMYNKQTGRFSKVSNSQTKYGLIRNDIDGGLPFWPRFSNLGEQKQEWIALRSAIDMKQKLTNEFMATSEAKYPDKKAGLQKFLNELKVDDNPVLMIVKLKE
jgi:hypothetical protein